MSKSLVPRSFMVKHENVGEDKSKSLKRITFHDGLLSKEKMTL